MIFLPDRFLQKTSGLPSAVRTGSCLTYSDSLAWPRPRSIAAREAAPPATKAENAEIKSSSGAETPIPVSAKEPIAGMWPTKIRSTTIVQDIN